jgi:hypothetical protein
MKAIALAATFLSARPAIAAPPIHQFSGLALLPDGEYHKHSR